MANYNRDAIRNFAITARNQMNAGVPEDALRHLLSTQLPLMFPERPWWILEHSTGAEANVHYIDTTGHRRTGFVDSLVGKTAIEYEKNLSIRTIFDEGYNQVKEYCAALINRGIPHEDIIGVLSDTVRWYAYCVRIAHNPLPGYDFGPDNILLEQIDAVDLSDVNDLNIERFGQFIYKYLGREGSRKLMPEALAADMGLESIFCLNHIDGFRTVVNTAFTDREYYASMIEALWQSFVAYLGGTAERGFDRNSYINELYIITLAKLLCANILNAGALLSDEVALTSILNGQFFKEKGFVNLVEYDYFGWLNEAPYINQIIPIAQRMQNDLLAYDFTTVAAEDLFGPLVAQLADKDRRLLLGQEYTPQWLAEKIVSRVMEMLPENENPNLVDMCCGSGVFIVEAIKQTIEKYRITTETCTAGTLNILTNSVIGFDIDPLAVILSKINWVLAMKDFIGFTRADLTIPVYHADSFFAVAPITTFIDHDYTTQAIKMVFDGEEVLLPGFLITPTNRGLFDSLIQSCYETAKARAQIATAPCTIEQAEALIAHLVRDNCSELNDEEFSALSEGCRSLITTLEALQREGRNGIWSFVLGNSYRPGLVAGQFNAIVSNPPWMATSKLADNPYKAVLTARSEKYGIKPTGSSHLHIELATIFLLNAVDKYLKENAVFGCVMPDSLLNGYHHEPFRNQQFLHSQWAVSLTIKEIWDVPADTFKNKAIVIFGQKSNIQNPTTIPGRYVFKDRADEDIEFRLLRQGRRTAWSDNANVSTITDGVLVKIPFLQGADIMPRTLVFHKCILQPNGKWSIMPIPRQNDDLTYLVSGAKKHEDFTLNVVNVDDQFIFDCYKSEHILPFYMCSAAKALLPMKCEDGQWVVVDEQELVTYGTATYSAFSRIFAESNETAHEYFDRINYRNKLNPQVFTEDDSNKWLVMAGAGGGYTCAAYISMQQLAFAKTIIDQTIYWHIAQSEDEALYITGLLNSQALDTIISDFQPEGAQGRRHVHKLPYSVTPVFDPENVSHLLVVEKSRVLKESLLAALPTSSVAEYCSPARSSLAVRRRMIRLFMQQLPHYDDYEDACKTVYGV
jgi:methylase of polypeptide subunit release factors